MKNVKQTRTSHPKKLCLAACMVLLAGNPIRLVNGEEASIMIDATVPTAQLAANLTPEGDVFINGSYKSFIRTASRTNPVDAAVDFS